MRTIIHLRTLLIFQQDPEHIPEHVFDETV